MRHWLRRYAGLTILASALAGWALLGGCAGCLPPPNCLNNTSLELPNSAVRQYTYPVIDHTIDARGVDWVGEADDGVDLEGPGAGCFVGGRIKGTWNQNDVWDLYHGRKGLPAGLGSRPLIVEKLHVMNFGDGVSLENATPCPNGSSSWLLLRDSYLEDLHDDAVESDGLCSVDVDDNLMDRVYVGLAFRNRVSEPNKNGSLNTVVVRNKLIRMHAFANNYQGLSDHNGIWKWARGGRGPKVNVYNNRFLAFDSPPGGTHFPFVNKVVGCSNNTLLFAGSEAEWQAALLAGCDTQGDDGLCDGERMLALSSCFTVITKPDSQGEGNFLSQHWDPYVDAWKASHEADDE